MEWLAGGKFFELGDIGDELVFTVYDDYRGFVIPDPCKVVENESFKGIGLAVAGAGDNPVMLEAGSLRKLEGNLYFWKEVYGMGIERSAGHATLPREFVSGAVGLDFG